MGKKRHIIGKHILTTVLWSLIVAGLLVTMGFVNIRRNQARCTGVVIRVDYRDGMNFLDEFDIRAQVNAAEGDLIGRPLNGINLARLEREVTGMNAVKKAEVYTDLRGNVILDIIQRKPAARIFLPGGKSGYIDETGKWMNLSEKFTARVIVINGNLPPFETEGSAKDAEFWQGMDRLVKTIIRDEFLDAQFEQVYVNENREVVLVPRVGKHTVLLGAPEGLSIKFDKLKLFYKEGLSKVDWNKYKQIDLRYKDQVVCTKR